MDSNWIPPIHPRKAMSFSSPLTRAKARQLARSQSPSRSVLTEPIYTSPQTSWIGSTYDSPIVNKQRRTYSRSARKSKGSTKQSFSPEDKENVSVDRSSIKSKDERSTNTRNRKENNEYSHHISQDIGSHAQKTLVGSYSTVSSPPYFNDTASSRGVVEDSSPVVPVYRDSEASPVRSNRYEGKNLAGIEDFARSKCHAQVLDTKAIVSRWFLFTLLGFVLIVIGSYIVLIIFSRRSNATFQPSTEHSTSYGNMLGWFQAIFHPRKNDRDTFQTAFSFIITQINSLAVSLEKRHVHPEASVQIIQGIMEKTESILKDGFPPSEFKQRRENLYRQLFHLIGLHEMNDTSSNDSIAKLLDSKLRIYYKLTEQDYALASEGAKIVCSTPSKFRQQSSYWLARMASILDPSIKNATSIRYPKGPETLLSDDTSIGNCWAFAGKTATVTIQLSKTIQPVAFSLEHNTSLPKHTLYAPKLFRVYLIQDKHSEKGPRVEWLVGTYHYRLEKGDRQLFPVRIHDLPYVDKVRLEIADNYGGSYTCLYRFRVHGHEQRDISQS